MFRVSTSEYEVPHPGSVACFKNDLFLEISPAVSYKFEVVYCKAVDLNIRRRASVLNAQAL